MEEAGCAIIGQTADLAPADKRLYGIRDVTATVESVAAHHRLDPRRRSSPPASHALVLDVKTGSGAFMATRTMRRASPESLVDVANGAGLPDIGADHRYGRAAWHSAAGNALEVANAVDLSDG